MAGGWPVVGLDPAKLPTAGWTVVETEGTLVDAWTEEYPVQQRSRRPMLVTAVVAVLALTAAGAALAVTTGDQGRTPAAASGGDEPAAEGAWGSAVQTGQPHPPAVPTEASPSAPPVTVTTTVTAPAVPPAPNEPPAQAGPATQPTIYQAQPNVASPLYRDGTCLYRIFYGNYGATAFAKLRTFGGPCANATVFVAAQRGSIRSYEYNVSTSTGADSCGPYAEVQAASSGDPAYGVGIGIRFAETGHFLLFLFDQGGALPAERIC